MNTFFVFNKNYYKQKEGLGMGLPWEPIIANIFMCNFETAYLDECPLEFKPVFLYKRYINDSFALSMC